MGALILGARYIAEKKAKPEGEAEVIPVDEIDRSGASVSG